MKRPNIIFIVCDQMRGDAFGADGNPFIPMSAKFGWIDSNMLCGKLFAKHILGHSVGLFRQNKGKT